MKNLPEGPRGKALAVAICALIIIAVYLLLVAPLIGAYEKGSDRLQARLDLVQRLQVSARELPKLRATAQEIQNQPNDAKLVLAASSDTVAAAMLQSTLKELVEQNGARLSSAEILPSTTEEQFQRIGIHVSFSGSLTLLTSVLRGIETARPFLFVDNIEIRGGDSTSQKDAAHALAITFDLFGFRPS